MLDSDMGEVRNVLLDEIMENIEGEGIAKIEVWQLLRDMEMVDKNGNNIWEREELVGHQESKVCMNDILEVLPMDLLPTK
jgi:hypothetical protein